MSKKLRAGIIGAGFMARVHTRAIRDSGHEVYGIASSSIYSARSGAENLRIDNCFAAWQELVASEEIDVVHICTPNQLHAEIITVATAQNKAIICEKPISTSFEEALKIKDAVTAADSPFAIPFAYRFYPVVRDMRSRIRQGEAGSLLLVHGSYLQDWLAEPQSSNWRVDSVEGGASRAFADIGMHWCDLMEFISGDRIKRLIAHTSRAYDARGVLKVLTEDIANILFETELGDSGTLTVSQVSHGRKNRLWLELNGSKASFSFDQEQPDFMWLGGQNSNQIIMHGQETLKFPDAKRLSHVPSGHPQGFQDAFNAFMADAYSGFQGYPVDGVPGLIDGVRSAALVHAVLESAHKQKWVEVRPVEGLPEVKRLAS
jgi:predicted dehydrogenase